MNNNIENYDELKEFLACEDFKHILTYALSHWNLAKLVNKFSLNTKDVKTTQIPVPDLAALLAKGAYSNSSVFKEVGETLNLYSGEAREAYKSSQLEEFQDSIYREENERRRKVKTARLIWALVQNSSSGKKFEGKSMIAELTDQKRSIELNRFQASEREDGDRVKKHETFRSKIDIKVNENRAHPIPLTAGEGTGLENETPMSDERARGHENSRRFPNERHRKEYTGQPPGQGKKNRREEASSGDKADVSKLREEIQQLKKERSKLAQQVQSSKGSSTIRELEKRIKLLENEKKELQEKIEKVFVSKEKYDLLKREQEALEKENMRLLQSYTKSSAKVDSTMQREKRASSFWKEILHKITPFAYRRLCISDDKNCRVGVFVDVQNMFYSAKNLHHGRLDFEKFLNLALRERKLVKAIAYIVKTPEIDQSKFINLLKNYDYEVKTLDLKTGMNGFAKGNWDVGMVMDIFEHADKLDVIALASGDGDFVPLVQYLQKKGIKVEVYGFSYNTAIDLKECADKFYPLQEDILIKDQRGMVKQH